MKVFVVNFFEYIWDYSSSDKILLDTQVFYNFEYAESYAKKYIINLLLDFMYNDKTLIYNPTNKKDILKYYKAYAKKWEHEYKYNIKVYYEKLEHYKNLTKSISDLNVYENIKWYLNRIKQYEKKLEDLKTVDKLEFSKKIIEEFETLVLSDDNQYEYFICEAEIK